MRVTSIPVSAASALSASSGITCANASTARMSTCIQIGASRVALGSKYSLVRSNCDGSGYAARATSAMPATPLGAAFE